MTQFYTLMKYNKNGVGNLSFGLFFFLSDKQVKMKAFFNTLLRETHRTHL